MVQVDRLQPGRTVKQVKDGLLGSLYSSVSWAAAGWLEPARVGGLAQVRKGYGQRSETQTTMPTT